MTRTARRANLPETGTDVSNRPASAGSAYPKGTPRPSAPGTPTPGAPPSSASLPPAPLTAAPQRPVGRRALLLGGGAAALLGLGSTGGWALNRYVVDHVEVADASTQSSQVVQAAQAAGDGTASATGYSSDTARIAIDKVVTGSGSKTLTYYVADVTVSDATIVRSAFANDQFGSNIVADTSVIAEQAGAVFAVNGDYYGFRDDGIQIRNGIIYRDNGVRQGLAFSTDGTMRLYDESATSAQALLDEGVWQTLSFGPGLVDKGVALAGIEDVEVDTNFGNHSIQGQQPRTGIGMIGANHFVFVAVDGRSSGYSRGVTMSEFAQIFVGLGAQVAYNIDGGGSTTMVLNGGLVNNPLGKGSERGTSDIIYVAG